MVLSFEPPARLLSMNDRDHHMRRSELVGLWRDAAYFYACQLRPGGPSARTLPEGRYRVESTLPVEGRRRRDPMNFVATVKAVVDGVTAAGVFPDDSEEFVTVAEPVLDVGGRLVTVAVVPARPHS